MWTGESEADIHVVSPQSALLWQAIETKQRLHLDAQSAAQIERRIQELADKEWPQIEGLNLDPLPPTEQGKLLAKGFALTAFLIAPVPGVEANDKRFCALGAMVNLMVVLCDRLIDSGSPPEAVVPPADFSDFGSERSPVTLLLQRFLQHSVSDGTNEAHCRTIHKTIRSMFDAEARTVAAKTELPYRFWLRKSALPFVLMALPAWTGSTDSSKHPHFRQLRWLYKVGRFLGAVDDAVDFLQDARQGHPNYWRTKQESFYPAIAERVAEWGQEVLEEWDRMVLNSQAANSGQDAILRQIFTFNVWNWMGRVRTASDDKR